jgi:(2R)-3-sulfolactate dehydrogenase (NADP+)
VNGAGVPLVAPADGSTLRVDAGHGFCHPAFVAALDPFADLTRRQGVALLTIHRSYSAGVLGWMVELLAERQLVSLGFANSSPLVAAWGGRMARLGTNPLAFAVPRADRPALVVDMATSATAWVNIRHAALAGEAIPLGWALDPDGQATTDPRAGLAGTVAPLGGAKGYALALMVEILAAGLSGGGWGIESSSFADDEGGPPSVGQTFIAIDPQRLAPGLAGRMEHLFATLLSEDGVRLPGDHRHTSRQRAHRDGVAVPDELLATIAALPGA